MSDVTSEEFFHENVQERVKEVLHENVQETVHGNALKTVQETVHGSALKTVHESVQERRQLRVMLVDIGRDIARLRVGNELCGRVKQR